MPKPRPISHTQAACLSYLEQSGGKIARYPGGFWMLPGLSHKAITRGPIPPGVWFTTATIKSLIQSKRLTITAWNSNAAGLFPTEAELTPETKSAASDPATLPAPLVV